ncbi:nucleotidyltransferase family protein [Dactylosporangium aurantiacum]|uniref:Nucleotidyltransferase family protein n=1 Tax=Dactylosporangium aurantiacum TaxID=35754 RepID=A0A9Q9IP45_9ACTN|nr:nucleotidyltransferase family protein [Dactylosporangium aurantiacum]MDG6103711.1 nucleotidyltransferase family protein [Dactylosporangium aurantiacum]UWZ59071.1 nucleotidyltransferase family protein [Dactylosporangium aurantiacum]
MVQADHPAVRAAAARLRAGHPDDTGFARAAFEFVRDEVRHSFDAGDPRVTVSAAEVLEHRVGLCYAKSHLLAALLRAQGVPAGLCYQRLATGGGGFVVHGLVAVHLDGRWHRQDPRGNKPGVDAQFSLDVPRLAFTLDPAAGERDYEPVHAAPDPGVVAALRATTDVLSLRTAGLPSTTATDAAAERELTDLIRGSAWMTRVLAAVRDARVPDAWTGAGALRDLVWGPRYGSGFDPGRVRDVDVAFFDPADLSPGNEDRVTERLRRRLPGVPWEAKNQTAVHTWYAATFGGGPVAPLTSIRDAIGTWPETATAVVVRLRDDDGIEVCAPFGLADLLDGVWRRNPRSVTAERSRARLARHDPGTRWPGVTVFAP